ncbi:shikimate kinase [Phormidium sp. CCY1219]|uniref:shikimate kinase n=1 Tax=Phormidium sp. CCY1219 TaxID=2886104 RepID=UPI002D1F19C1|nr:shikimate kinase [Phormidium sp. CCY1219]MEB3826945.1 shikimate kinase [Phormidium sp. CCY1219]
MLKVTVALNQNCIVKDVLKGCNIYLVGMMGAGKSTVGKTLADRLNYRFFDTDALIEQIAGQTINQIFAESGEAEFRALETKAIAELCAYKNLVVATGGGIILKPQNWSYLQHGIVVWLDVPVEELYKRLQGDSTRPLLKNPDPLGKLRSLLEQRQALYAQADVRISITAAETPALICDRIFAEIRKILKPDARKTYN